MDYYLCSTVRHLLFSLLRSLKNRDTTSHIFMITDQQNICEKSFNIRCLPQNIIIHFIQREKIRSHLYLGIKGKIIKLLALRNCTTTERVRAYIHQELIKNTLDINIDYSPENNLFIFNDRNKIARLFRLMFEQYELIEEGMANYYEIDLKRIEKFFSLFSKNKRNKRYFGDDSRCKNIYLLSPEKSAVSARHKTKQIDFISEKNIEDYGYKFFNYTEKLSFSCIIATQPYDIKGQDLVVYQKLKESFEALNINYAFKPHPREDITHYQKLFPNVPIIESKIPLELIIFGSHKKCNVISICSSAGIGFEKYCQKINLIQDHELSLSKKIINDWYEDKKSILIDSRIEEALKKMNL